MNTGPKTLEELFFFAIANRRRLIGEFESCRNYKRLYIWALVFAGAHGFRLPTEEECGYEDWMDDEDWVEGR